MKYKVSCYNGGPLFGLDWVFVKPDEVIVNVEAKTDKEAIKLAKELIERDYYKVIGVE